MTTQSAQTQRINPVAQQLNAQIEEAAPEVFSMLSAYGRRLYFPKGILSQSAEAKQKAHRFNATIGIATEGAGPMYLPSVQRGIGDIDPSDVYPYAPASGRPVLRERWREKLLAENPGLAEKAFGEPIVTSAITHGLALVGELFVDEGDAILMPDMLWGNYRLNYEVNMGGVIRTFPFYAGGGFNVAGFDASLAEAAETHEKVLVVLNFPNNPTGYMPTPAEGEGIVAALQRRAEAGTKLVVITDDAYFGLFYHLGGRSMTESLFAQLCGLHENLLAVKLDGATKELFVWGLRCGFITFGPGRADTAAALCTALEAKVKGAIRGGVSNVPQLSQSLVERALSSSTIDEERKQKCEILRGRAERVYAVANEARFAPSWDVYPFNSGYFMCVRVKGVDSEQLRVHLLDAYGVGLISTAPTDIRIAFSCLEVEDVEPLFEVLDQGIKDLQAA